MKKIGLNILNQIIPVMIGVYLGFALNNFGEERKVKRQVSTYKKMLTNEIKENLEEMERVRPYHIQLAKDFNNISKSNNIEKAFKEYSFKGLKPGFVNNSAYDTGIQTGVIQQFDLRLIQSINKLYTLQKKYNRFNEDVLTAFMSKKFPETADEIRSVLINMNMNMNDIQNFERELENFYREILKDM